MNPPVPWQRDILQPDRLSAELNGKTVVATRIGVWVVYVEGSVASPTLATDGDVDVVARRLAASSN